MPIVTNGPIAEAKDFYEKHKVEFQVTSVVLVVTALVLSISETSGVAGVALRQLKFFLLAGSTVSLLSILVPLFTHITEPLVRKIDGSTSRKAAEAILSVFFIAILLALFVGNLIFYLIASYSRESVFLGVTVICYYILSHLTQLKIRRGGVQDYFVLLLSFLLLAGVPAAAYIIALFPNVELVILSNYILGISALVPFFIFFLVK